MIEGSVALDELMASLLSAHETYQSQLVLEIREEEERAARDAVKREQDLAFEMSLVVRKNSIFFREGSLQCEFYYVHTSLAMPISLINSNLIIHAL